MTFNNENQKTKDESKLYLEQLNREMPHCKIRVIDDLSSESIAKSAFIVQDIVGALEAISGNPVTDMSDKKIIQIYRNEGTDEEKLESIKKVISAAPQDIICADVYISEDEFPELKANGYQTWGDLSSELKVRVARALERDVKIYEKANFVNINNYVEYEYKVAMIYANEIGRIIIDEVNKVVRNLQKKANHVPPRPGYIY